MITSTLILLFMHKYADYTMHEYILPIWNFILFNNHDRSAYYLSIFCTHVTYMSCLLLFNTDILLTWSSVHLITAARHCSDISTYFVNIDTQHEFSNCMFDANGKGHNVLWLLVLTPILFSWMCVYIYINIYIYIYICIQLYAHSYMKHV